MRIKNSLILSVTITLIVSATWLGYKKFFKKPAKNLFTTQKPEIRDIQNIMHAEGTLEAHKTSKIGPLFTAKIKEILVKEGETVTKGTLLAKLQNDKGGDTGVRLAKAQLEQAQINLIPITANYKREKALYESRALSKEAFEQIVAKYQNAQAEVIIKQAAYDKELFEFDQTNVRAPEDGIVVSVGIDVGETVSPITSPQKVMFEIAQDLSKMKATLYVDENKIGDLKKGMPTEITVDTYPYKQPWTGNIENIGLGKFTSSSSTQPIAGYKTEVLIDNTEKLLRPGMTVHAKTILAEAKQALAVPGFVFQLSTKVLEDAAKMKHYTFQPIDPAKKKEFTKNAGKHPIKTLWVFNNNTLTEKAVEIGVTDNAYFQILSGLTEHDNIIADDMTASEELQKIAKQVAG